MTRHGPARIHPVREDAAEGPGKQIHGTEGQRHGASESWRGIEVVAEVEGQGGVHDQLDAKASPILEDHQEDSVVLEALDVRHGAGALRLPQGFHGEALRGVWQVLAAEEDPYSEEDIDGR